MHHFSKKLGKFHAAIGKKTLKFELGSHLLYASVIEGKKALLYIVTVLQITRKSILATFQETRKTSLYMCFFKFFIAALEKRASQY